MRCITKKENKAKRCEDCLYVITYDQMTDTEKGVVKSEQRQKETKIRKGYMMDRVCGKIACQYDKCPYENDMKAEGKRK